MTKAIKEIHTDISGNVSVEYSDDSTRNFNMASTLVIPIGVAVAGDRTLTKTDLDQVLDVAAAAVLTIPTDAILGITADERVCFGAYQKNAGAVSWATSGTTLRGTAPTAAQYGITGVVHVGADEWAYIKS